MTFIHFVTDISSGILSGISSGILPGISSVISSWWKLHGYQPFPLQASHCVLLLVCDVASRSAASLPNVTWRHRLQFRLQNKHAKTCWSSPASLMSCRLQCSLKNKHTKTCWRPPESLMSCRLQHSLEIKHARTLWETIWISDGMPSVDEAGQQACQDIPYHHLIQDRISDVHCTALETDTAFPLSQNKIKLILTWWTLMKSLILIRHLNPCRMHRQDRPR